MIRYAVTAKALRAEIETHKAGWLDRSREKTAEARKKGRVDEGDGIWSEIKGVYARLQFYKCVYCEKPMPQEAFDGEVGFGKGAVEYDVEHYRPKNRVKHWPTAAVKAQRQIDYDDQIASGESEGYFRLAFDPDNYALSCKTCNSGHKSDSFPIAGTTKKSLARRAALDAQERPLLMLGLGEGVDDPEDVIGWVGPLPFARKNSGYEHLRARVSIDFFALDTRGDLMLLRAQLVTLLWGKLEERAAATGAEKQRLDGVVQGFTAPRMHFCACARAYVALHASNRPQAAALQRLCWEYILSRDRAVFSLPAPG